MASRREYIKNEEEIDMIVSFKFSNKSEQVATTHSEPTKKNRLFVKFLEGELEELYDEALRVLDSDLDKRYQTIFVPKRHGGKRRIDIPDDELKRFQRKVVRFFTIRAKFLFPDCANAYIVGRSNKTLAQRHMSSEVLIHFDLKDFFKSCTMDLLMRATSEVYPFALMPPEILQVILGACMLFYDGDYRLPQGASSSPFWSNVAMIPFDKKLDYHSGASIRVMKRQKSYYSRYADDIFLSYKNPTVLDDRCWIIAKDVYTPKPAEIIGYVYKLASEYGLTINQSKTFVARPGESAVRMLGLTVSPDGIKIGHKEKQRLKAALWSFLADKRDGRDWAISDTMRLKGRLSHARFIEPDYVEELLKKYELKSGVELAGWI